MNENSGKNTIRTDEKEKCAREMALFDDPMDDPIEKSSSNDVLMNVSDNADAMHRIAKSEVNNLIPQVADLVCAR